MPAMRLARPLTFAMSLLLATQTVASPVARSVDCVGSGDQNYFTKDKFARGLDGVETFADPFGPLAAYVLTHCASGQFVRVEPGKNQRGLYSARAIIVEMIADAKDETLQDVVDRLKRHEFVARIGDAQYDTCLCAGDG